MKAVGKALTIIIIFICFLNAPVYTQNWGNMNLILWENPPFVLLGFFSPSFSQSDSLLYFDTFYRLAIDEDALIYTTHLDSVNQYNELCWSDPQPLPSPINLPGSPSAMPCINHTGDSLFFSSDRPGSFGGFDIYLSVKSNNQWSEPINLGDSINSSLNEFSPSFSIFYNTLFFDRYIGNFEALIYGSNYLGDNIWTSAAQLPSIINSVGNMNFSPYFNDSESTLYFTVADWSFNPYPILHSSYVNGNWTEPVELGPNINGFYGGPNACSLVTTEHPSISRDTSIVFYNKHIWEYSFCYDFFSYLFYSRAQHVNIENGLENQPKDLFVINYPNPFNSQTTISYQLFEEADIALDVYDILGRKIITESLPQQSAGLHKYNLDMSNQPSGMYFAIFSTESISLTKKLTFLK